jgi:membrane protein DedA with SNARE-associated domain
MDSVLQVLEAHGILLAVLLPPAIRLAGHWLPEEPLMVAMGMLAARSEPQRATLILLLLWLSHALTDNAMYSLGRIVPARLGRWPNLESRVRATAGRVNGSPWALAALVPVRVLPLGRGAWLMGFGLAGVPRLRFIPADGLAVAVHLLVWCGLGWWLGSRAGDLVEVLKPAAGWALLAAAAAVAAVWGWRRVNWGEARGERAE